MSDGDVVGRVRLEPVRVERFELRRIAMPLVAPFRTSFGVEVDRDILLVRVVVEGDGSLDGWGECVALAEPTYSAEYVEGAQHVTERHLLPRLAATAADHPGRRPLRPHRQPVRLAVRGAR